MVCMTDECLGAGNIFQRGKIVAANHDMHVITYFLN